MKNIIELTDRFLDLGQEGPIKDLELLRDVIRYHERMYYVENDPIISDYQYDALFDLLKKGEAAHPESVTKDSPTQRVSSDLSDGGASVAHITPMLSLANSYNGEDLRDFDRQIKKLCNLPEDIDVEYVIEPKFDGGSIAIVYEEDSMVRAATRGNGSQGEDITANARVMYTLPMKASFKKYKIRRAEIRGEAVIRKDTFEKINESRAGNGLTLFANPRNAATGGLRMKNPAETKERGLEVFAFQLGFAEGDTQENRLDDLRTHSESISLLKDLGFKVPNDILSVEKNIDGIITRCREWEAKRDDYPYEIDGMVIKVNRIDYQQLCGSTQHHPRWAIAYKFKAKQATTTLENVTYQIGKIGSITPVAKLKPVALAGVTISSVSLHNEEFITSRDLRIGDQVIVERAGDVIPYIVKAVDSLRNGSETPIVFPKSCPSCTTELIKEENEAAWRCPNFHCPEQELQRIIFHVSKAAMDIDGFGKSYVEKFYEYDWLKDISDVYALDYSKIADLEGFGEKSVSNLKAAIEAAKTNSLSKLLHSLSIHHLGKKASQLLAAEVRSVWDLQSWEEEDFIAIKDIGPVVAKNVMAFFKDPLAIAMLRRMEERGVNLSQTEEDKPKEIVQDAAFSGKKILFTGKLLKMGRKEAQQLAEVHGASNISAVSKNLDILVVGEKAGSKLKKAQEIGTIEILTEDEFLQQIHSYTS